MGESEISQPSLTFCSAWFLLLSRKNRQIPLLSVPPVHRTAFPLPTDGWTCLLSTKFTAQTGAVPMGKTRVRRSPPSAYRSEETSKARARTQTGLSSPTPGSRQRRLCMQLTRSPQITGCVTSVTVWWRARYDCCWDDVLQDLEALKKEASAVRKKIQSEINSSKAKLS